MNALDEPGRELYTIYLMYIILALEVERLCKNFIYLVTAGNTQAHPRTTHPRTHAPRTVAQAR